MIGEDDPGRRDFPNEVLLRAEFDRQTVRRRNARPIDAAKPGPVFSAKRNVGEKRNEQCGGTKGV